MPLYGTQHISITPGDPSAALLFNAETPATGAASIAVAIEQQSGRVINGLVLELVFAASPGAFNYQIQGADTDSDADFLTEGSGTVISSTGPQSDGTFVARVELSLWLANFVRIKVAQQNANGVAVTARVRVL